MTNKANLQPPHSSPAENSISTTPKNAISEKGEGDMTDEESLKQRLLYLRLLGLSRQAIADKLNEEGYQTPVHGRDFMKITVIRYMRKYGLDDKMIDDMRKKAIDAL